MNVAADAEQPRLMRGASRGLGNAKLGTSQEDNDDDNDDDVNNPMALMRKVSSGQARSMFAIQSDSGMMEEGGGGGEKEHQHHHHHRLVSLQIGKNVQGEAAYP